MSFFTEDERYMHRALELAKKAGVNAAPNPMVGAVIVHNGKIIGEGYHERCGEAHAEVNAVASVTNKELLTHSTIYVTLEPCAHYGKTPPCAELLIKYRFKRVVIASFDPFSLVAGKGLKMIQDAGIETAINILEKQAQYLNRRFFTFHIKKRPYVILKWAQTKDGFIDILRTTSEAKINWITQPETQVLTHKWRTEEQAILVSWKTVRNDNPSLNARAFSGKNPLRVILDRHGKSPIDAKVFQDGLPTVVFTENKKLIIPSVEIVVMDVLDSKSVLSELYKRNILSLIIEGGATIIQNFINENLWDEARVLVGINEFKTGVEAPRILQNIVHSMEIGKDKLFCFENNLKI